MQQYYKLLGVPETATENEIKKAFKNKAKLLHPDRNKSATAHEDFLALYEAFNEVLRHIKRPSTNNKSFVYTQQQKEREREQAIRYAQMKYKAWVNSKEYKELVNITTIGDSCIAILVYFICILLPVMQGFSSHNLQGALIGLLIGIVLIMLLRRTFVFKGKVQIIDSLKAIKKIVSLSETIFASLFIINCIVFFTIGLSTVIWISILLSSYIVVFLILHVGLKMLRKYTNFQKAILAGAIISGLLCFNYFTSSNSYTGIYSFNKYNQHDSLIEFNNNELKDYVGIRLFNSIFIDGKTPFAIKYVFENGGLGIDVVKEYIFLIRKDY